MNWENTRVICCIANGADKHTHIFEELNQLFVFIFKITHVVKIQIFMHNFNLCDDISKLQVSTFEKQDLECVSLSYNPAPIASHYRQACSCVYEE